MVSVYKRKKRPLKIIRKSVLTGVAVWVSHERTYKNEWHFYKKACREEVNRMRQWANMVNRRRQNILSLLAKLTEHMPLLGDVPEEKREAARVLARMAETPPPKQSDFYDHIREEARLKRNARKRDRRWQEKYGGGKTDDNQNYDK